MTKNLVLALAAPFAILMIGSCAPVALADNTASSSDTDAIAPGGVVSAADPRAAQAGQEILRKGGSAADAAMAMMLALTVVEPQSSGIGGGGFLLHHDASSNTLLTVDGRETAPSSANEALFLGDDGQPLGFLDAFQGGHSVGVPGNMRLMAETHKRWGRLEWAELFAPAIRLAEQGYSVNATLEGRLARLARLWPKFADARGIYWQDGRPKKRGERITNPALGQLLRDLAQNGADAFYSGKTAQAIISAVAQAPVNPAAITADDLADYTAKLRPSVCMDYRQYTVCGMGPPSSGATTVLQILGTLSHYDIKTLGQRNAKSWYLIGQAMQLAYADRNAYLADPDFAQVPVAGLLDADYLQSRAALISESRARADYPAGAPPGAPQRTAAASSETSGTTHFVAVDGNGNVASMTSTIEGPFGSQLIARGMFLNNELTDFTFAPMQDGKAVANRVQPGKRPLSSMSPTIVYKDGKPVLALGSAGGKRIIMHVAKTLIGFIDFDLPADAAIALPNIYFGGEALLVEQDTWLAPMAGDIARFGQTVVASGLPSKVNAAQYSNGKWVGAADPRSEGIALAP